MKIEFNTMQEKHMPEFKGGVGEMIAKMHVDESGKIMFNRLPAGSSVGNHKHETDCEIIYILEGTAKCLYDDVEEQLTAGDCHYCPKGHSHSLINAGDGELAFFAVVR